MTGLVVLAAFLIYLVVAVSVTAAAKGRWTFLSIALFVLIPTWDIIPGKLALAHYCKNEGGIKIYRSVDGVEGFLTLGGRAYEEFFRRYGYKYVEIAKSTIDPRNHMIVFTEYSRITIDKDGNFEIHRVERPLSRYAYREAPRSGEGRLMLGIVRNIDSIVDLETNEILATRTEIYWRGNWLQRLVAPTLGSGGNCDKDQFEYKRFYVGTLRPLDKTLQ